MSYLEHRCHLLTEKELQVLLLRKQGLLQTAIAKRLGITQGAVSRFEANAKTKIREALTDIELLSRLHINHEQSPYGVRERLHEVRRWRK